MSDPLLRFRDRFPILGSTNYLISNSLGAMPRGAEEGLAEYASTWATRGVRAWGEGWWEMSLAVGDLLGPLLGTGPGEVSMHQNVAFTTGIFLSCLDFSGERNRIVCVEPEFPSLHYLYHQHPDAEVVTVPSHDGLGVDHDELLAAIDERTKLVAVSHVFFRSSFLLDAKRVAARAREVGALTLLDTYQSTGTMPIDLYDLGVDAAVGGCLKWLCGGPGNCFLWVRPELGDTLEPRLTGWAAHPRPFAFETGRMEWRTGGARFLNGTPNIPGLYAARAGLEILAEAGMEAVREKSTRQTAWLMARFAERGFHVNASEDPARRGGTVAVEVPHAKEVAAELNDRDVCVDYRPGAGIRLSPHFYTRDEELVAAADAIDEILETGAWRRWENVQRTVT